MTNIFKKLFLSYRQIPDKKPYVEFFTALLSIPVLLTVILLNVNSLRSSKDNKTTNTNTSPVQEKIYVTTMPGGNQTTTTNATASPCKQAIGPISIDSPQEGDTITNNPVNVDVNYQQGNYCAVVWSYRINGGSWSDFDNKSIALYNPPSGIIKLELRVKSVVANGEKDLTRNFTYKGSTIVPTISQNPVSSSSAN
ncbi:MAG TPA: hypothetical protein VE090_02855 [Methylomirabilota bacterium]|nr:hypothetical protein [Methylomirabilota bacterium]